MTKALGFSQSAVTRAAKGVLAAGLIIGRIEIDIFGKIVINIASAGAPQLITNWDEVL